jgi:hypothetical protein
MSVPPIGALSNPLIEEKSMFLFIFSSIDEMVWQWL